MCKTGILAMKTVFENKFVKDIMMTFFSESICPLIALNSSVCEGGTRNMGGPLLDAFTNAFLKPEDFCENTIIMCHDGDYQMYHAEDFVNRVLATKPTFIKDNYFLNNLYDTMDELTIDQRKKFKVVHVSDPHVDYMYEPGSDAMCNDYLCCRAN
jgi:hypothetical protein